MNIKGKLTAVVAIAMLFLLSGCLDDGQANSENGDVAASVIGPSKVIVKAALIDVLWDLTDEPDANALCVANSTFTFTNDNPIMMMKNLSPTDYNEASVIVVGSLNIPMNAETEGRASECASEAATYVVTASEQSPIDVVPGEDESISVNFESRARNVPSPYPTGCKVTAHFEKSGYVPEEIFEEEDVEDENVIEEETYPEDETAEESSNDDEDLPETDEPLEANYNLSAEGEGPAVVDVEDEEEDEVVEQVDDEEKTIYSMKLVIDSYDCTDSQASSPSLINPRTSQPATLDR